MALLKQIQLIQKGYSEVRYLDKKYGVTKSEFNNGHSYKIYAKELGGTNFISMNYYITSEEEILKPCEMPEQKVIHFLNNMELL
ncbi:peptide methionine sulfoxide reductase [Tenacibaculum sp.]|nr:peptide methionine sulfoxide reductase [Tenacibaculum sp.]